MSNINTAKRLLVTSVVIPVIIFLSLFSILINDVSVNYPYAVWEKEIIGVFYTFLTLGVIFFFATWYYGLSYISESSVSPLLIHLNEIIYPNKDFNFPQLKSEIIKLKSNELKPKLTTSQAQLTELITKLQNKVSNDAKAIIELFLQAHAQMISQDKENDSFVQNQLINFEDTLQNHLTKEELQSLRELQKETLYLEKHLNNLRGEPQQGTRYDLRDEPQQGIRYSLDSLDSYV